MTIQFVTNTTWKLIYHKKVWSGFIKKSKFLRHNWKLMMYVSTALSNRNIPPSADTGKKWCNAVSWPRTLQWLNSFNKNVETLYIKSSIGGYIVYLMLQFTFLALLNAVVIHTIVLVFYFSSMMKLLNTIRSLSPFFNCYIFIICYYMIRAKNNIAWDKESLSLTMR